MQNSRNIPLGNQIWDKKNLENAWKQVKANRGSAGVDGVTIDEFERNSQQYLAEIERQLKENRYVPQAVKEFSYRKIMEK